MRLCPRCRRHIRHTRISCPHCGHVFPRVLVRVAGWLLLQTVFWCLIAALVVAAIVFIAANW
jgi:hypothetical protein